MLEVQNQWDELSSQFPAEKSDKAYPIVASVIRLTGFLLPPIVATSPQVDKNGWISDGAWLRLSERVPASSVSSFGLDSSLSGEHAYPAPIQVAWLP